MGGTAPSRLRTLDLIRGIAVLGILAINITGFAAPSSALYSPDLPQPGSAADHLAYAVSLVFFEGKMRALFATLFGASLVLFISRQEERGRNGPALQLRRLLWLAVFGLLHFALLWRGDILFLYSLCGLIVLGLWRGPPVQLAVAAGLLFSVWQLWGTTAWLPSVIREAQVSAQSASPSAQRDHAAILAGKRAQDREERKEALSSYPKAVMARAVGDPGYPLRVALYSGAEILSYMMIGMALLKSGFFAGEWRRRNLRLLAFAGTGGGLALSAAFAWWAERASHPELAMQMAIAYALGFAHLLSALGYAGLLVLLAARLLATPFGLRLEAAGRMAFSNYIGTSLVMTGIFHGWGLGWFGRYGAAPLWLFTLLGWGLMLAWSKPWVARFGQGPLERVWRQMTFGSAPSPR